MPLPPDFLGYCNRVRGDETTDVIRVEKLSPEEQTIRNEVNRLKVVAMAGIRAQVEIEKLRQKCAHHVFRDTPEDGWTVDYYYRHCVICDQGIGQI